MAEIMSIDLERLIKTFDGKQMNFFCKTSGEPLSDTEARETLAGYLRLGYKRIPMRKDDHINVDPEKDNSRLGRLRRLVKRLEQEKMDYIRRTGSIIVPPKMQAKLLAAKEELAEAERYAPQELRKLLSREKIEQHDISPKMVKVHIAADYLTDVAMVLRETLSDCGIAECNLFPIVEAIERKASEFAGIVCHPEFAGLSDFMTTNETLINHLDTLVDAYLKEHLTITDSEF